MKTLLENEISSSNTHYENPAIFIGPLRELGIKQGYVTYEDILGSFPEAEQDIDFLERIFTVIYSAGILYSEETNYENKPKKRSTSGDEGKKRRSSSIKDIQTLSMDPDNLVGLYFNEAGRCPLLTADEEVDLAKRIERGLHAREEILNHKFIDSNRREELKDLIDDGSTAVNHLISANSRLVISIAKKYIHRGVPFLDLIQEGNIGLMRAVKRFDYKRGYKFGTYATWWIRQAVTRSIENQSRIIRLPVHQSTLHYKILRARHFLEQKNGREPDVVEISEELGITPDKIQQIIKDAQYTLSLDMPTSLDDDSVLGDYIEDHNSPDSDDQVNQSMLQNLLEDIFDTFPPREVQILKLRFGLLNGKVHTLQEVGLRLGVSRERIRQIEAQALRRLRRPEITNKLQSYRNQPNA